MNPFHTAPHHGLHDPDTDNAVSGMYTDEEWAEEQARDEQTDISKLRSSIMNIDKLLQELQDMIIDVDLSDEINKVRYEEVGERGAVGAWLKCDHSYFYNTFGWAAGYYDRTVTPPVFIDTDDIYETADQALNALRAKVQEYTPNKFKLHLDPALARDYPEPRTAREWATIWQQRADSAPTEAARENALVAVDNWSWMALCDEANAGILPDEES